MSGSHFEKIAQEILSQKRVMEDLETENHELKRQLADLREGRGIFLEIQGQRFTLLGASTATSQNDLPEQIIQTGNIEQEAQPELIEKTPTAELIDVTSTESSTREAQTAFSSASEATPGFLEEIMLDEFSAALTAPTPIVVTVIPKVGEEPSEDEKAALRRELLGSFLLG